MSNEKNNAGAKAPATLEEALEQLKNLQEEKSNQEIELGNLKGEISLKAEELEKLKGEVISKDEELEKLKGEVSSKDEELEKLKADSASKEELKEVGLPKVTISKGPRKGVYQITAAKMIIPGIPGEITADKLASDLEMVEELIKIESGIIVKL